MLWLRLTCIEDRRVLNQHIRQHVTLLVYRVQGSSSGLHMPIMLEHVFGWRTELDARFAEVS